jgi:predicted acetyltransferase
MCYADTMIEIRRLTPAELPQLFKMFTIVYNQRRDYTDDEQKNKKDDPLEHPAEWAWGAFDRGKLLSGMFEIDFRMRFDSRDVKMSGIGGVGTLPEARTGGLVRQIFEKLLPEAYENGVIFSNLTPFSHDFYRMFGYEVACARNQIEIPAKEFLKLKPTGEFIPIFPGDDTAALQEVHSAYIRDLNHGICRDYWPDNRAWKRFTQSDPYTTGTFLYLWKDERGIPRGYIKYQDQEGDEGHIMSVLELAFIDREGLYGALGIVGGLSAQFKQFRWLMPAFIDPCDLISNTWEIDQQIRPRDMTRIINVAAALEKMRYPLGTPSGASSGEGAYTIAVEDAHIPANTGSYLVEFEPEGSRVSRTNKKADIQCDMRMLSQLVTGYRTLENALRSRQSGLEVFGNEETLRRVFTLRPQHVTEYF